jgi:hypothetical protein
MKSITRTEALNLLRQRCMVLVDDEHSLCHVAARLKILCGGFSQWTSAELKERYQWILQNRPRMTRQQIEDLANRWQLARQFVSGTEIACDNQIQEKLHQTCHGWDEHSLEDLARYCEEMTGEPVEVVPDAAKDEPVVTT